MKDALSPRDHCRGSCVTYKETKAQRQQGPSEFPQPGVAQGAVTRQPGPGAHSVSTQKRDPWHIPSSGAFPRTPWQRAEVSLAGSPGAPCVPTWGGLPSQKVWGCWLSAPSWEGRGCLLNQRFPGTVNPPLLPEVPPALAPLLGSAGPGLKISSSLPSPGRRPLCGQLLPGLIRPPQGLLLLFL